MSTTAILLTSKRISVWELSEMAKLGLKLDSKDYFNHRPTNVYSLSSTAATARCWSSEMSKACRAENPLVVFLPL